MVVYYVIALALFMSVSYGEVLRCLLEGLGWLGLPVKSIRTTGPSGISEARSRVGAAPLRRLYQELVGPIAVARTQGASYRGWRPVTLDGSTLDVADEAVNETAFGRPGTARGVSGYPQIRFVSLLESGTHVLFGAHEGPCTTSEIELARTVLTRLRPGMLSLARSSPPVQASFAFRFNRIAAQRVWRLCLHGEGAEQVEGLALLGVG